jgi:hypothetical protein
MRGRHLKQLAALISQMILPRARCWCWFWLAVVRVGDACLSLRAQLSTGGQLEVRPIGGAFMHYAGERGFAKIKFSAAENMIRSLCSWALN